MAYLANGTTGLSSKFSEIDGKLMDGIDNVIVNIDDLLIHSKTHEHHLQVLDVVITRLEENKRGKMFFRQHRSELPGFQVDTSGYQTRQR
jgi:hypothetical protein